MAFAKYKGVAENRIADLGLGQFYSFRPGYIYPVTPRKEPGFGYRVMAGLYPLIRLAGNGASIKSTRTRRAMVRVGIDGADTTVLENRAIVAICRRNG